MVSIRTQYIESVLFVCEAQDKLVQTGHRMRPAEFETLNGSRSFRCGACGGVHSWTNKTAQLGLQTSAA